MTRDELIISTCREAGYTGTDEEILSKYKAEFSPRYLAEVVDAAAEGVTAQLAIMRCDLRLPPERSTKNLTAQRT